MKNVSSIGTGQLNGFMKAQFHQLIGRNGPQVFNLVLITVILLALQQKEISFNFNISRDPFVAPAFVVPIAAIQPAAEQVLSKELEAPSNISLTPSSAQTPTTAPSTSKTVLQSAKTYIGNGLMTISDKLSHSAPDDKAAKDNLSNTYSNMTYHKDKQSTPFAFSATLGGNAEKSAYQTKRKKQDAYVARFAHVAKAEMKKYGIPASITLAQGLIESNAGESRLSKQNNNHFGMKCFSKKCSKGHCSNFTDDSHKDFFRKYETAWESFRAHSQLLTANRYRRLFQLHQTDYKGWANGLQKAGYATDPKYAQKLIHIIEELELGQYDR
jgi:flagellum-specific peptidoglycan hydrolase FlgJ